MIKSLEDIYKESGCFLHEGSKVSGVTKWQSPSNIALVKYWGKHGNQLPANPSLSLTLSKSFTETEISYSSKEKEVDIYYSFELDGAENKTFANRIGSFLKSIEPYFPFLTQLKLAIKSHNTFPHSSGIASSASAYSALALCLCSIEKQIFNNYIDEDSFLMKASFIARLGSGSASRSVYGEVVSWGDNNVFPGTSDLFASDISLQIHPVFKSFKNSILIIDSGQKKVSSSLGHSLMKGHPFATTRFSQANANFQKLAVILKNGDVEGFIEVVENEALTLHSMMMTSKPWFILMSPETIKVLSLIREYREETGVPVCFTVDAGPNIHLLYPREYSEKVSDFINSLITEEFVVQNVIFDDVGKGPLKVI